ncbi:MAG: NifB/NifX family molybdenum-iron cluster-binding protein [Marinobacterium sp.]
MPVWQHLHKYWPVFLKTTNRQVHDMKIAVSSQNRKTVTEHAGRCRRFWIYTVENGVITDKNLLELSKEESFHDSDSNVPHPLDGIDVLLTGGMGSGLAQRLARKEIVAKVTTQTEPDKAIQHYLDSRTGQEDD